MHSQNWSESEDGRSSEEEGRSYQQQCGLLPKGADRVRMEELRLVGKLPLSPVTRRLSLMPNITMSSSCWNCFRGQLVQ